MFEFLIKSESNRDWQIVVFWLDTFSDTSQFWKRWIALVAISCHCGFSIAADSLESNANHQLSNVAEVRLNSIDVQCLLPDEAYPKKARSLSRSEVACETAIDSQAILDIVKPLEGKVISASELIETRDRVTELYLKQGYPTSGAVLPPQNVADGNVLLVIVEGRLAQVEITGLKHLKRSYLDDRFELSKGDIVQDKQLQHAFGLLISNPNVEKIDARLLPRDTLGEAVFSMDVVEKERFGAALGFTNDISPSVGGERKWFALDARNLIGYGDLTQLEIDDAVGYDRKLISFELPITANDLALHLEYQKSESQIIEKPISILDITTDDESYSLGLSLPLFRSDEDKLFGSVNWRHIETQTSLLNQPFSFSLGAKDGRTSIQQLESGLLWIRQSEKSALAVNGEVILGLDGTRVDGVSNQPEEEFIIFLGQIQFAYRMTNKDILKFSNNIQWTNDQLYSANKLALGGNGSVRGYRKNVSLGDTGAQISIEYQHELFSHLPFVEQLSVFAFADVGWLNNNGIFEPYADQLSSIGVGINYNPISRLNIQMHYAHSLQKLPVESNDLQDDGFFFSLTLNFGSRTG